MPGLQRCIGTTGFVQEKRFTDKIERVTYRRPRDLTFALGGFNVSLTHWGWTDYGEQSRQISEGVTVIISSAQPKHYADYVDGPVRTLRTLGEFISSGSMSIENLWGQLPRRPNTRGFVELLYARRAAAEPDQRTERQDVLLELRRLRRRGVERFVQRWHRARTELAPALDMFSALLTRPSSRANCGF
jgi:hypothetical protein